MDDAVGVAVHETADPNVHEDPFGLDGVHHPEGVVKALPAAQTTTYCVPAAPWDVVAEHGEEGRIDHQVLGHPDPHGHTAVIHGRFMVFGPTPDKTAFQVGRN